MTWTEASKVIEKSYESNEYSIATLATFVCHLEMLWGVRVGDFIERVNFKEF